MALPRRNDFLIPTLAVVFDSIAIEFSFLFSYWLRFRTDLLRFLPITEAAPPFESYVYGSFFIVPVWLLIFKSSHMYGARRNISLTDELFTITKLVTLGMLVVMSAAFFYRAFSYSRLVFGLLWGTAIISIFIGRLCLYHIEKALYQHGRELRNAAIIGNTDIANLIYQTLNNHPLLGYKLVGYFANTPYTPTVAAHEPTSLAALPYLGKFQDVSITIVSDRIELALIALDHHEHPRLLELVRDCEGVNVEFMLVPDLLEIMTSRMYVKEIEGIPFIKIKNLPMTTWGRILKRAVDVVVSGILLALLSPLFLLIAIAITLDSRGSVFFRQERVGLDGKRFRMLKFRSMKVGSEQFDAHAGLGIPNDARRTRFGKFLRGTNLDELPQFINVLTGEMSLVGPRPERPYFVEQFKSLVPKYLDRHRVKTGITGWAQVNGFRGNTSLEERIKYDIYYIENWSLWFDVKILLKTIHAVFSTQHIR